MNVLEHMMHLYDEALDELMGAEKYTKCMEKSESAEDKSMYRGLAKQELEHEMMICKSVANIINERSEPMLRDVWNHLRKHLMNWRGDLEHRIMESEK